MARRPRLDLDGFHHIINRGVALKITTALCGSFTKRCCEGTTPYGKCTIINKMKNIPNRLKPLPGRV